MNKLIKIVGKKVYSYLGREVNKNKPYDIQYMLDNENFKVIPNVLHGGYKKITFVLPTILKYGGGYTSVLRLGTYMANHGYDVYYGIWGNQSEKELMDSATINLKDYKGKILTSSHLNEIESDIVVATNWQSVYYVRKMSGYKMYFIQDYEPYFHAYGESFFLAKQTYELGLHMISLGEWNKKEIEKNCNIENVKLDWIEFPYEKKEYTYKSRNFKEYANKDRLKIAVYIKRSENRLPNIIQIMLRNLKNELESKKGIFLEINIFGLEKSDKVLIGNNLGKLTKLELQALYEESDFGMVASSTNISLVPYEMIATGLPIIEFEVGTFKSFFSEDAAILTNFDYKFLYNRIVNCLQNPEELEKMLKTARHSIENLSWTKTCKQFKQIIENITVS